MGQGALCFLREGGVNAEDYIYNLFPNVVVHCIDIYANKFAIQEIFLSTVTRDRRCLG